MRMFASLGYHIRAFAMILHMPGRWKLHPYGRCCNINVASLLGTLNKRAHIMWQAFGHGFKMTLTTSITADEVPAPDVYASFPGRLSTRMSFCCADALCADQFSCA